MSWMHKHHRVNTTIVIYTITAFLKKKTTFIFICQHNTLSTGNHFFSANGRGVEQYGVHDTSVHHVKISQ